LDSLKLTSGAEEEEEGCIVVGGCHFEFAVQLAASGGENCGFFKMHNDALSWECQQSLNQANDKLTLRVFEE